MARRRIESWIYWIVVDVIGIGIRRAALCDFIVSGSKGSLELAQDQKPGAAYVIATRGMVSKAI
jgi:hypothetical protein